MDKEMNITEWIKQFDANKYNNSDRDTQIKAGWYDWFCKDTSLRNKTYSLAPKIKQIANLLGKKFCDTHYLFFKNNCPMNGKLYDDFRFCDIKNNNVVYTIIPKSGFDKNYGKAELWGIENDFDNPIIEGKWKDIIKYFENRK